MYWNSVWLWDLASRRYLDGCVRKYESIRLIVIGSTDGKLLVLRKQYDKWSTFWVR